jgi:hypothetical protein
VVNDEKLATLLAKAAEEYAKMTPAQRDAMHEQQRLSWARGEAGMGSDADEAAYRRALRDGDRGTLTRLEDESKKRMERIK